MNAVVGVNITDHHFGTPLATAVHHDSLACARMLLEQGADVEMAGKSGRTPLMIALSRGHFTFAQMLVDVHKADPKHITQQRETGMHMLAHNSQAECMALLSWGVDPWVQNSYGLSSLHYAVERNNLPFVRTS